MSIQIHGSADPAFAALAAEFERNFADRGDVGAALSLVIDGRPNRWVARFSRAAVFAPYAVPAVIGATVWGFLYAPSTSPLVSGTVASQSAPMDSENSSTVVGVIGSRMNSAATMVRAV